MIKIYGYIGLLYIALLPAACKKGGCNVVPDVNVYRVVLFGEHPKLRSLRVPDTVSGGVAGIIVMKIGDNDYVAYDRCSTVNPEKRCAVRLEENGLVARDPCSEARYMLVNGSPAEIAECPLKPYRVSLQPGGNAVIVTN